ncbi:MAG TPA: CvpA family protein [Candidatus Dormibacteraeota bacterium]|nr:CvpA family protein [Candidatus Dormibacteraeota bacterium]
MTWIDAIPIVLIVGFGVLGYFTGVIRRLIVLVALYIACVAATNMGLQAGGILQQTSSVATPDARIYGFFGILIAVMIVIDGAAQLAHSQIQLPAIVFNRVSGAVVGVLTGLLLSLIIVHELHAAGNPIGGSQLDGLQTNIRDAVHGSHIAVPLTNAISKPIIAIFQPVLPPDPQIYFGPGPVNP